MSIFIGMHTIRLKEGNRLRVPAEFCRSLQDDLLDEEKRLCFVRRESKITLEPTRPTAEPDTTEVSMDTQGTLTVTDTVMKWLGANHGNHFVLVGAIDTIEVFTAKQWLDIAAAKAGEDILPIDQVSGMRNTSTELHSSLPYSGKS